MALYRILQFIAIAVCIVFFSSCSFFSSRDAREDFIRIRHGRFVHQNAPYYYAGANMWYGGYLGSPGSTGNRPRLVRELDSLKSYGIGNLRVLAASEASGIRRSVRPAMQTAAGVVDDSLLQGLDFLLAEMAKRDMHAVLYLGNYWEWSGGFSQYNVWTGGPTVDPEDTTQGWGAFMDYSATFYTNARAQQMFRSYVKSLIRRTNSVNGRTFSADPTIMAWQLANEPRPGRDDSSGIRNLPAFYRWLDETARYLHDIDTNHLVCSGSEGTMGTLRSEEYFLEAYRTPAIDYLNFHLWPLNWGWFNPEQWEATLPQTETRAIAYINTHIALARTLNKPVVMDEYGLGRDGGVFQRGTPTNARDRYFRVLFRAIEDSARSGAPLCGTNVWAWGGEGKAFHDDGVWRAGDSFVGDPPQEPQGRNSVFISDTSTIAVLREHARRMSVIGIEKEIQSTSSR